MGNCFSSKNINEYDDSSNLYANNHCPHIYKETQPLLSDNKGNSNTDLKFDIYYSSF